MNSELLDICKRANEVKFKIEKLSSEDKDRALNFIADELVRRAGEIISENDLDIKNGKEKNMSVGLLDRLKLDEKRILGIAEGVKQVTLLKDPIGEVLDSYSVESGLEITKVRVPMGVIGIIYESRPNVTVDAFSLTFKSGNAVILKGGSDAINSNRIITKIIRESLGKCGIPEDAIQLITATDREVTKEFMTMKEYVDLLIPRGGAGLIRSVVENSTIPVIETGTGNCHIFIDESAPIDKSIDIIINAKTQRVGVCNACESLVIHEKIKDRLLPKLYEELKERNVEVRGDKKVLEIIDCNEATEEDFATEYLDYIISMKVVSNVREAIDHINKYTTHHSEAILTENKENADLF